MTQNRLKNVIDKKNVQIVCSHCRKDLDDDLYCVTVEQEYFCVPKSGPEIGCLILASFERGKAILAETVRKEK